VAVLVAGGAARMLPVSLNCPLPLRRTHPPTLLLQFAAGFVITPRQPWREIKTKYTLEPKIGCSIKAKQRKEASGKSVRPARPLQLFSQQGLYNARPARPQPKMGCRPS